jgi:hypothetical protein
METIAAIEQTQCDGPGCTNLINQQPGGHRRRRFCSDDCKQRAYRDRQGERRQREIRERWADFSPETQQYLDWLVKRNDDRRDFVEGIEAVIRRERGKPPLSEADAMAQARLHTYIGNNWYLEATQRVFVELLRVYGHEMASKVRTAINQERGHARQAIELPTLPTKPIDEHSQQFGQWIMECGKRLKYPPVRLEQYKKHFPGFFEETEISDIQSDRSHWQVAAFSFSPKAQLVALVHLHQAEFLDRLLAQERDIASHQAFHAKVMLEGAQRDARDYSARLQGADNRLREVQQTLEGERARREELERKSDDGAVLAVSVLEHKIKRLEQELQERNDEVQHLKTRIDKQLERRITKQQKRIEELEQTLQQQSAQGPEGEAIGQLAVWQERVRELEEQVELERQGREGVQRRFRDFVRMTHEKQLVRNEEEDRLPSRDELIARFLVVGERLQFCRLLVPHIHPGIESWQAFIAQALDEHLRQAVTSAEHYYENLVYLDELEQRSRAAARERRTSAGESLVAR